MTRYAAENFTLRQENRQLRSLDSVRKAEEAAATTAAELDEMFQKAVESESKIVANQIGREKSINCIVQHILLSNSSLISCAVAEGSSNSTAADSVSAAAVEKLKAQLIQKQSDFAGVLQAFEDYKEITK